MNSSHLRPAHGSTQLQIDLRGGGARVRLIGGAERGSSILSLTLTPDGKSRAQTYSDIVLQSISIYIFLRYEVSPPVRIKSGQYSDKHIV